MQNRLFRNISANIVQQIVNQLFGVVIFFVLSRQLDKSSFGQLNGCLALLLICFSVLSFGLDQLIVKKIAAGEPPTLVLSLYMIHIWGTGLLFYSLLAGVWLLFPTLSLLPAFFLLSTGKFMSFVSSPYKQYAAGREEFMVLARMSVISNIVKGIALIAASFLHHINLPVVITLYILGDAAELLGTLFLYKRERATPTAFVPDRKSYHRLLSEAWPQLGTVLCTAAMSRFDWLLLGIAVSDVQLAEYSFAYKAYEMMTLPLLAIAPLLIPRFVKQYQQAKANHTSLYMLIRLEMLTASLVIVAVNLLWVPLTDALTNGRYGAVNRNTIFLLSLCTPLLYISNILWTSGFAQNRLRSLFMIIGTTCAINITGDYLLIPLLQKEGAALACLLALLVQTVLYFRQEKQLRFARINSALLCSPLCAITTIMLIRLTPLTAIPSLCAGIVLYLLLTIVCGLWNKKTLYFLLSHAGLRQIHQASKYNT